MKNLKIAIIQTDIIWESKEKNFKYIEENYFNKMSLTDVDLILLPEVFATGFTMKPEIFFENENGITFEWLKKWSSKLNSEIGGGLIMKDDSFKNTFVIVNKDGIISSYDKRHLFRMGAENNHYSSGEEPVIHKIKNWKINLQICYDLRFPVFSRNHINQGTPNYDILIYIANWPKTRTYAWTNLLRSRAIENQSFSIGVNRVGVDKNGISHSGESTCIDPNGVYILKPVINNEGVFVLDLKFDLLQKAREKFPVLLDADNYKIL